MRIVSFSYSFIPAYSDPFEWLGRISFYTGVYRELAKEHEVHSIEQIRFQGRMIHEGVHYHFLNPGKQGRFFHRRLHRYIAGLKPDLVLVHGFLFPLPLIGLKKQLGPQVKVFLQNHAERPFKGIKKFLQARADKHIDAYFFTEKSMGLEWVEKKIIARPEKLIELMEVSSNFRRNAPDAAARTIRAAGRPVYLWVGRLDANKDPVTVVKAFIEFNRQAPDASLHMIFQTNELLDVVRSLIQLSGSSAIQLVGKVPHQELDDWYNSADFIISGSHYEGSGVAVCEAMSCGCIPILTAIPSFRKMTGYGNCGLLYAPGEVASLVRTLHMSKNMDLEKEKQKVLEQFEKELSFRSIAKKMSWCFQQVRS